jgi:hypothetical protein
MRGNATRSDVSMQVSFEVFRRAELVINNQIAKGESQEELVCENVNLETD